VLQWIADPREEVSRGELTRDEKNRRVVLKRVNIDRKGYRPDILKRGTIARGAIESGIVENYMNGKIARNLFTRGSAGYKGAFTCTKSDGGFTKDTQWLVWDYESDTTLGDALDGKIGSFPGDVEDIMLRRPLTNSNVHRRDVAVIRRVMLLVCPASVLYLLQMLSVC
jgi:hypothetical protein